MSEVNGSPRSFARLREAFDRLAELEPAARHAELERLAGEDAALGAELGRMLAAAERTGTALDGALLRVTEAAESPPAGPGFQVRRRLGRGGSATVYLAVEEHADFERQVALKVVDRLFDPAMLRRVRDEQRILARLEHPGIARLYDAGVTADGRPYLAMELVEGESILDHCRARQLSVRQRIELFLAVVDAVEFAHQQDIVHRDLKPANILVSSRGEAKLLDFGIAKWMAPAGGDETHTLRRAMTPAYASPEQLRGERVGPASDIYSLGVVLYELLTGTSPYRLDSRTFEAIEDAIRAQEPEPPSAAYSRTTQTATTGDRGEISRHRRALRGDLDAVLLKALRKETQARYASAAALAEDLRRYLSHQPVAARRGSWRYRAGKLLRRHRGVAATLAATLLVLVALAAVPEVRSWWLAGGAARPRGEYARFHEARSGDRETRRLLAAGATALARHDPVAARGSFQAAVERSPQEPLAWDGLAGAESGRGDLLRAAAALERAAGLASRLPPAEQDLLRARDLAARRQWPEAVPALEGAFGRQPGRVDVGLDLLAALIGAGRNLEAETALGRLRQLESAAGEDPRIDLAEAEIALGMTEYQRAAAVAARARDRAAALGAVALGLRAERLHAEAIMRLDRRDEARRDLESVLERAQAADLPGEAALARLGIGSILLRTAGNAEAQAALEEARAALHAAGLRSAEVVAMVHLSLAAGKRGELEPGLALSAQALEMARESGDRWAEGFALSQRLVLLNWADDVQGALALIEPTLAALRESSSHLTLLATLVNVASTRIEQLELDLARSYIDEAEVLARRVGSQSLSSRIDRTRGYLQETLGDYELARQSYNTGLDKARRADLTLDVAFLLAHLARLEVLADRPAEAERAAREAVEVFQAAGDPRLAADIEAVLAWVEARRGDVAAARTRLARLKKAIDEGSGTSLYGFLSVEARVAEVLGDWRLAERNRRETIRMAREWSSAGLLLDERLGLARALAGSGRSAELERLLAELLPEAERHGLRAAERELRALGASHRPPA